jgi:hypothetical protein
VLENDVVVKRDFWLTIHQDLMRLREVVSFLTKLIEDNRAVLLGEV